MGPYHHTVTGLPTVAKLTSLHHNTAGNPTYPSRSVFATFTGCNYKYCLSARILFFKSPNLHTVIK